LALPYSHSCDALLLVLKLLDQARAVPAI